MKRVILSLIAFQFCFLALLAQPANMPALDKSPMDMSYYPNNFPVQKIQDKITDAIAARIIYSRPQKAGRLIFGGLVEFGKVWRLGANEATEIEFFKTVHIGGKKIQKGRYTLYGVINENTWTIIINRETDTWGAFKYNSKKDVVRVDVPLQKTDTIIEDLSMIFDKTTTGFSLIIEWDNVKVVLPITL